MSCDTLFPFENSAYPVTKWSRLALFPKAGCRCKRQKAKDGFFRCALRPAETVLEMDESEYAAALQ